VIKKLLLSLILLTVNLLSAQTDSLVGDETTDLVAINALLKEAGKHLGTHYRGGGKTPAGFDCSGFVGYCYNTTLGIRTPASSSLSFVSKDTVRADASWATWVSSPKLPLQKYTSSTPPPAAASVTMS
jgi:cell wall-associated NlpC family hydrolase